MALRIQCGNCGQKYEFEQVTYSFDITCSRCGAVLIVPVPEAPVEPVNSEALSSAVPAEPDISQVPEELVPPPAPKIKLSLRINSSSAPQVAEPVMDPPAAVAVPETCPRHPSEAVSGNCARCGAALCGRCSAEYGHYCSAVCLRATASEEEEESRRAYHQEGEKLERFFAILKMLSRVALVLLLVGVGWLIWKWFLDPAGKLAWNWKHEIPMDRFLVLRHNSDGITLLCDDTLFNINAKSGAVVSLANNPDWAKYAVGAGKLIENGAVLYGENGLAAIDLTGKSLWKVNAAGKIMRFETDGGKGLMLSSRLDKTKVVKDDEYPSYIQILQAVDLKDGRILWTKEASQMESFHNFAVGKDYFVTSSVQYNKGEEASVVVKVSELASGEDKWQVKLKKGLSWGPVLLDGTLLFRVEDTLHGLQVADGKKLWSLPARWQKSWGEESAVAEVMYRVDHDGLTAVNLAQGKILWTAKLPSGGSRPMSMDGKVFVISTEEKTVAPKLDVKLPPAYEQLRKEDPAMDEFFKKKGKNVKYIQCLSCFDAADGTLLWRHEPVFGNLVTGNGRAALIWDSATTTVLQMMGSTSGDTVVRQLTISSGKPMFERPDPIGMRPPYFICGTKLIGMVYDRDASRASIGFISKRATTQEKFIGMAAFNLK